MTKGTKFIIGLVSFFGIDAYCNAIDSQIRAKQAEHDENWLLETHSLNQEAAMRTMEIANKRLEFGRDRREKDVVMEQYKIAWKNLQESTGALEVLRARVEARGEERERERKAKNQLKSNKKKEPVEK